VLGGTRYPDQLQLPISFDPRLLLEDLAALEGAPWTPHFVPRNYVGDWSAIPLRAPKGAEHPILMIASNPDVECVDAPALRHTPYFRAVLSSFECELHNVRLMRLDPGSSILEHRDPGLCAEDGSVRIHIPIVTNPETHFYVNDNRVEMAPGEVWYLRLSDPHRANNFGNTARIHMVIDMDVNPWLIQQLSGEQPSAYRGKFA
jgi:hypothetical protein